MFRRFDHGGEEAVHGADDRQGGVPAAAREEGLQEEEAAEEGAREKVSGLVLLFFAGGWESRAFGRNLLLIREGQFSFKNKQGCKVLN